MKKYTLKFNLLLVFLLSAFSYGENINLDTYKPLVGDVKSYAVGEPIVVIVVESTLAEASAATGVERNTGIQAAVSETGNKKSVGLDLDANSDGAGKTSRKGRVTTQLSATIVETLENGMLKIKGIQDITINGESQKVMLQGVVRASDISKDNSIFSYQIANAQIEITGEGDIGKVQKQNFFFRFLNWLGVL